MTAPRLLIVVDDNPDVRGMVRRLLPGAFAEEVSVCSCDHAEHDVVFALLSVHPDATVLSSVGRDERGLALVRAIRERFPQARCVLMTGGAVRDVPGTPVHDKLDLTRSEQLRAAIESATDASGRAEVA